MLAILRLMQPVPGYPLVITSCLKLRGIPRWPISISAYFLTLVPSGLSVVRASHLFIGFAGVGGVISSTLTTRTSFHCISLSFLEIICNNMRMSIAQDDLHACVLLEFRAENARSFRDPIVFSMVSSALSEPDAVRHVAWRDGGKTIGVLPTAGVFGSNASGKSNLLRVMNDMRDHVLGSFRSSNPVGGVQRHRFRLNGETDSVTRYEMDLIIDGVRHEYGFVCDDNRFTEEWAYHYPHGRAALIFSRIGEEIEFGSTNRSKSKAVAELLRPNALFLSTAAAVNHEGLLPLYGWFSRNLQFADARTRPFRQAVTAKMLGDEQYRQAVLDLLSAADLGIVDAKEHEVDPNIAEHLERVSEMIAGVSDNVTVEVEVKFEEIGVRLVHSGVEESVVFEPEDESMGTLVWFGLVGPIIHALTHGSVFLADELDASLHTDLVKQLVLLFQNPRTNPRRAQLIFNSHDHALLGDTSERIIGRDQIWFTEKDSQGNSRLYPLTDMDPRKQEAVGRRYLEGRYGATPIISESAFADAVEQFLEITAGV